MRIAMNERCQGHARCIVFAPDTFEIDNEGYAFIKEGREVVAEADRAVVLRAANNCPERAIDVIED